MQRPGRPGADLWLLPGGGVKSSESPLVALRREVWEETGLALPGRPRLVWRRAHTFERGLDESARVIEQHEDIYLVLAWRFEPTPHNNPEPSKVGTFHEFRWWSVAALKAATRDQFASRTLPALVEGLVGNGPPPQPIFLCE